jgi:hypothetical protein
VPHDQARPAALGRTAIHAISYRRHTPRSSTTLKSLLAIPLAAASLAGAIANRTHAADAARAVAPVRNVVLVHGASEAEAADIHRGWSQLPEKSPERSH